MADAKEPLVLLHGVTMSGRVWDGVLPLLSDEFDVVAPTALGHRGGPAAEERPIDFEHLIDAAERGLDEIGLDRPHLAGNSMGGWIAIELARRGRARSVCALAPAGFWTVGTRSQRYSLRRIKLTGHGARLTRRGSRRLMRSATFRRVAMRFAAVHGDRVSAAAAYETAEDMLECAVLDDLTDSTAEIALFDPLPCPITLAWSERDRLFPLGVNSEIARERLPDARYEVLPGVGHVPMFDDPELVAAAIRASATEA